VKHFCGWLTFPGSPSSKHREEEIKLNIQGAGRNLPLANVQHMLTLMRGQKKITEETSAN
jgi:hypothetical protein